MTLHAIKSIKDQSKFAMLVAYTELLIEDPLDITDQHFRLLLKEMSPREIVYITGKVLENESVINEKVINKLYNYLERSTLENPEA